MRAVHVASLIVVSCLVFANRASAHATPHVLDILFRDDGYVLLSNRGLIFGDADRKQWRLMCAEALGINTSERPSIVATPDRRLLVGTSLSLLGTRDGGCTWEGVAPFAETSVPALVADPSAPSRLYLAAYTAEMNGLGGVYVSEDAGVNWKKLRPADERDYVRSILVAPSDAKRIYATGQSWDAMGKYTYYLLQSRDAGATWERKDIPLEMDEVELRLFAVSPNDPETIILRAASSSPASNPERLLVSRDGGGTLSSPLEITILSAFAFSADASKAWVVGQDGLYESTDDLATFSRAGNAQSMSYVVEHEGRLLAAGLYAGLGTPHNGVGATLSASQGFEPFMQLSDVTAPVDCAPATTTAMECAPWWLDWQRELMTGEFAPRAGAGGAAGAAGAAGEAAAGSGGSAAGAAGAAGAQRPAAGASGAADAGVPPASDGGGCDCSVRSNDSGASLASMLFGVFLWARKYRAFKPRRAARSPHRPG